jgi:hypothetical protein
MLTRTLLCCLSRLIILSMIVVTTLIFPTLSDGQAAQCTSTPVGANVGLYQLSASSGTPIPQNPLSSYVFKNDTPLVVRLSDINPFAFQCSISSTSQAFQETAISSFLGDIGGVANVGASTPNPSPSAGKAPAAPAAARPFIANNIPQPAAPRSPCVDQYLDQVHELQVLPLQDQRDAINAAFDNTLTAEKQALQTFAQDVQQMRSQTSCNNTVQSATILAGRGSFAISAVNGVPLDQAIDQLGNEAQTLYSHLTDGMDATCKQSLAAMINEDSAFLAALAHGTTAVPAAIDQWRNQLNQLNTVNSQLSATRSTVQAVLQNRQNFAIDTPVSGNQTDVKVTASCNPVATLQVPSTTSTSAGTTSPTLNSQSGGKPAAASTSSTWSQDFNFGPGPRFILSGGIVISPLSQITYSTSANPTSGGLANIIIKQQQSNTRILPIAMLSGRFWDQLPYKAEYRILPNYLSVGVTAKSTGSNGTNIEYLLGLSWAFANRQLFFTAGAYSGWQQRLNGGLTVGQATSLSSSNLPTSETNVWKPGFSITWAPGGK